MYYIIYRINLIDEKMIKIIKKKMNLINFIYLMITNICKKYKIFSGLINLEYEICRVSMREIRRSFVVLLLLFLIPVSLHASGVEVDTLDASLGKVSVSNQDVDKRGDESGTLSLVIIRFPQDTTLKVGVRYVEKVTAKVNKPKANIIYSLINPPEGMSIIDGSGTIKWIPKNVGEYTITVSVTSGKLNIEKSYTITVFSDNLPPVITHFPDDATIEVGQSYTEYVSATGETPENIRYSLINPPDGMTIDAVKGTIEWTPANTGDYPITVSVTDGILNTEKSYTITVVPKNEPPVITHFPNDTTIEAGQSYKEYVSADDETPENIRYSLKNSPEEMTIDAVYGTIEWTPTNAEDYPITVSVTDGILNTEKSYTIKVVLKNLPPVITHFPNDTTIEAGQGYTEYVSATDETPENIRYSLKNSPEEMTINADNGTIEWTPANNGDYPITVSVTDGILNTEKSYTIKTTVSTPESPILSSPSNGLIDVSTSPTLIWNSSSDATSYTLQVSQDNNFSSYVYNQDVGNVTSKQISGLSESITYYWRVNASNSGGTSEWSSTWSFVTIITTQHFSFTSGTGDSYNILIGDVSINGVGLELGDEIGVFTSSGLCVGAVVYSGSYPLGLTAWEDDSQTPEVDGYIVGDEMMFKIWDKSENMEVEVDASYTEGNGTFGYGAYSFISMISQIIDLNLGWNWISFNVEPSDLNVQNIFASTNNLEIVKDNEGKFYVPGLFDNIGTIDVTNGYKVYVSASDRVCVTGTQMDISTTISLTSGWNLIAYIPTYSLTPEEAFSSISSNLVICKNDDGKFYVPGVFNNMPSLTPGEAYQLYLSSSTEFVYPSSSGLSKQAYKEETKANGLINKHFKYSSKTEDFYPVLIDIRENHLEIGDEVGVFINDGNGEICVGSAVFDGNSPLGISIWKDDAETDEIDGYREQDNITFKVWKTKENKEIPMTSTSSPVSNLIDPSLPYLMVSELSTVKDVDDYIISNYPNPFNPITTIRFFLPNPAETTIEIYNVLGQKIKTLVNEYKLSGSYEVKWDGKNENGKNVSSGVYLCRLEQGRNVLIKRMTILR